MVSLQCKLLFLSLSLLSHSLLPFTLLSRARYSLSFSFSRTLAVSSASVYVALHPSGAAVLFSLSPSPWPRQAPSSSFDRCPARLGRVRWRSYRSPTYIPVALAPLRTARCPFPSRAHDSPLSTPATLYTHQRRFRRKLTRSRSSSSHRQFSRCYRLPPDSFRTAREVSVAPG